MFNNNIHCILTNCDINKDIIDKNIIYRLDIKHIEKHLMRALFFYTMLITLSQPLQYLRTKN